MNEERYLFGKRKSDFHDVLRFPEYATKTASSKTQFRWTQDAGCRGQRGRRTRASCGPNAGRTRARRGHSGRKTQVRRGQDAGRTRAGRG